MEASIGNSIAFLDLFTRVTLDISNAHLDSVKPNLQQHANWNLPSDATVLQLTTQYIGANRHAVKNRMQWSSIRCEVRTGFPIDRLVPYPDLRLNTRFPRSQHLPYLDNRGCAEAINSSQIVRPLLTPRQKYLAQPMYRGSRREKLENASSPADQGPCFCQAFPSCHPLAKSERSFHQSRLQKAKKQKKTFHFVWRPGQGLTRRLTRFFSAHVHKKDRLI